MNEDFESYQIDDEDESDNPQPARRHTLWELVPQVMIMPTSGWEKMRASGPSPDVATIRFLLPLSLLSGASVFFSLLYPNVNSLGTEENSFTILLVNAVIMFCSFFIGYYVALLLEKIFLPKDMRDFPHSNFGKLMTMTGIGTLALFHILFEAFIMLDFILVFLPLWTIFILYKGIQQSGFHSEKELLAVGVICVVVIASPTLVEWILALFS